MAKKATKKNTNKLKIKSLNAFNVGIDDNEYIAGTRQQQDIDLEDFTDKRIKDLLDGKVNQEDDEELDSDELLGSESDYGMDNGAPESDWGESLDESELIPLSAALDLASDSDDDNNESSDNEKIFDSAKNVAHEQRPEESEDDSDLAADIDISDSELGSDEADSDLSSDDIFSDEEDDDSEPEDDLALRKAIRKITDSSAHEKAKLDKSAGPENPDMMPSRSQKLSLSDLTSSSKSELELLNRKIKSKVLEMPLPERVKARGDRAAAYDLAKEEISKWEDTVKENRRAEHLSFPINAPPAVEQANPFVPAGEANDLEKKVNDLLTESHIKDEKSLSAFEEVAPTKLTFEEMKKRRQELRMMRELMFREEQRAKRIKKIKSKSYRRVHKKERLKQEQLMREAGEISDEDPEEASRKRAMERASLKHKTTSKWAKRMIDSGMTKDSSTRSELDAMLRQGDSLRQKVIGDDNQYSSSDDDGDENDVFQFRDEPEDATPKKGLLGMKFMQDGEKRQKIANQRLIEESDSDFEQRNTGRRTYGPGKDESREAEKRAQDEADLDDEKNLSNRLTKKHKRSNEAESTVELRYNNKSKTQEPEETESVSENPWLNVKSSKNKKTFTVIDKDSSKADKAAAKLSKAKGKGRTDGSDEVNIDVVDTIGEGMVRKDQLTFQQKDLIRKAFAGDDVVAEFEAEKQQAIEDDGDREVDETLPGWGSWGGDGLKPKVQRIRKVKGVDANNRKDYGKAGVLINEKINKKINKYAASAVPFPYENAAQYERSLSTPIGNEWATRDTFQRQTKPRVMIKKGEIIDPIKRR